MTNRYRSRLESLLAVDEAVQSIVNNLFAKGILDNTYIVFTSDNGFMQGQHRLHQGKFVAYDESAKVPLLIRGPGIPAGTVSSELVSNVDMVPTLARGRPGAPPGSRWTAARSCRTRATRRAAHEAPDPARDRQGRSPSPTRRAPRAAGGKGKKSARRSTSRTLDLDRTAQLVRQGDQAAEVPRDPHRAATC